RGRPRSTRAPRTSHVPPRGSGFASADAHYLTRCKPYSTLRAVKCGATGEECPMSRFLIMTWDGAGNLAPTLGIAATLVRRGHDVRLMGHRTIAERCGDVGTRFVPLSQDELWDAIDDPGDFEAEIRLLIDELS